jgi:dolichyl-phosphate-mannose-protein mannosyltransferase
METTAPTRRFQLLTLAVTALAFLLRVAYLPSQSVSLDDFSVGLTAINFVESGQLGPIMWNHPDLCNLLVYLSLKLFGTGAAGLKGMSVLTGTLSVTMIALVGRRLTRSEGAALVAAALWAVDSLAIDLSRQAVHEIYQSFFPLLGIYLALRFRDRNRSGWLVASGVAFGLGLASKWSAAFPLAVTCALLARDAWRERGIGWSGRLALFCRDAALLVILPTLVYLITFLPWFGRGYTLSDWGELQRSMYQETRTHTSYNGVTGDFRPVLWFVRPVAYQDVSFNRQEGGAADGPSLERDVTVLLALTNPLVWLLVLPALLFALARGVRERDPGLGLLGGFFLAAYLPLLAASRPIWANTAVSVLPYGLMAVGYLLVRRLVAGKRGALLVAAYLALVSVASVPLYLLATGLGPATPVLREYVGERLKNR